MEKTERKSVLTCPRGPFAKQAAASHHGDVNFSRAILSLPKTCLENISVRYSVVEVPVSTAKSGKLIITHMSAFLMVSNAELREEDGHLPVYVMRMPHLVPHLLHHFVFRFVGFLCFVKKSTQILCRTQ